MKTQISFFRKILFLTVMLFIISVPNYAQDKYFKAADLLGKKWSMQGLNNKTYEEIYDNNKITMYFNGKYLTTYEYYLSDTVEFEFNSNKVGTVKEGKYITTRMELSKSNPDKPVNVSTFEIIELSPTKLIIRNVNQPTLLEYKAGQ